MECNIIIKNASKEKVAREILKLNSPIFDHKYPAMEPAKAEATTKIVLKKPISSLILSGVIIILASRLVSGNRCMSL
jgi:hypothetical protein